VSVPYYEDGTVTLHAGDALDVLRGLGDGSADCVVISPPYWGLRDYGTGRWAGGDAGCVHRGGGLGGRCRCGAVREDRQYGVEATPEEYVDHLRAVFAEVRRVLAEPGTVWLNLGDSYSAAPPGRTAAPMRSSTLAGRSAAARRRESVRRAGVDRARALPPKNLLGMPWRVAFALQADGWILRNAVVWHKPNADPSPVRDRLANRHEMLFLLVRQPRYHFDLDAVREPYTGDRPLPRRAHRGGNKPHTAPGTWPSHPHPPGRNPGDVWTVPVAPQRNRSHPAASPVELPLRCIRAGCPPGGMVLDPFSGTGTTGVAALRSGRSYTGIDLNPAFTATARNRLEQLRPTHSREEVADPAGRAALGGKDAGNTAVPHGRQQHPLTEDRRGRR
jgi:site-specific DNA-methyltransferase (cytosine-N4-specific)